MTNAEKFEQIFGYPPDHVTCPFECSEVKDCPYFEEEKSCRCNEFWESTYTSKNAEESN